MRPNGYPTAQGPGVLLSNIVRRRTCSGLAAGTQYRWPIGMPLCRSLGAGLWEARTHLSNNRIARVLFFVEGARIGVLHGFVKKTQKTPADVIALAEKRVKEMSE
jgi:phage-related protein